MIKVAVAILNYNGSDYLKNFLPSVLAYSEEAEVFIIDNASTDDSIDIINVQYPAVKLIQLKKNHGFAEGYNLGLAKINARYFLLLNSDVEVTPHWITPMLEFLENNPEYATCQPKILDLKNRDYFEHAGAAGGFIDYLGYPFCRGRILDVLERDEGQYNDPLDILWTSGACMLIRSETFKRVGGFDSDFYAHMEEIDLCWRIYQNGEKAICLPESKVYHLGGGTLTYGNTHKIYLNFRNSLIMLCKNLPVKDLIFVLLLRLVLDILAGLSLRSLRHMKAILSANWDFYTSIPHHFRKRSHPKRVSNSLLGNKWMVFFFFLKRKKTFSEL